MTKKIQHPDAIDTIDTEEKRAQRMAKLRANRERRKEVFNEPRRWLQARALWSLYNRSDVIKQTIVIGSFRQEMLLSHRSIYSV